MIFGSEQRHNSYYEDMFRVRTWKSKHQFYIFLCTYIPISYLISFSNKIQVYHIAIFIYLILTRLSVWRCLDVLRTQRINGIYHLAAREELEWSYWSHSLGRRLDHMNHIHNFQKIRLSHGIQLAPEFRKIETGHLREIHALAIIISPVILSSWELFSWTYCARKWSHEINRLRCSFLRGYISSPPTVRFGKLLETATSQPAIIFLHLSKSLWARICTSWGHVVWMTSTSSQSNWAPQLCH